MQLRAFAVMLSILSLSAFACEKIAPPAADPDVAEQQIRDLVKQWNTSLAAKDDSAIGNLYTADARLLPPYESEVTGTAEIRRYFAELWPLNATLVFTTNSVKVASAGDLAIEEGTWAITMPSPTDTVSDNGKYLVTWVRRDNNWKVYQDIWNSSNAPAGPPTGSDSTVAQ
jgi:uncharacterized protein (TIGR02246 family)